MSHMSDLDIQLREAGIDPESLNSVEEALDLLRGIEIAIALDGDCAVCEVPEEGIIHFEADQGQGYYLVQCDHRCRSEG
mgnify:FL=1